MAELITRENPLRRIDFMYRHVEEPYQLTDYEKGVNHGLDMATEIIETEASYKPIIRPQWIPVAERLPEKYGVYLCTFEGEDETDVDTLLFAQGAFGHIDWEVGEFVEWGHEVTAWMALPEPYIGE